MTSSFEQYSDGKNLCGDDFSSDQIEAWFRDEEEAYYRLPEERAPGVYAYHARNWRHGFRQIFHGGLNARRACSKGSGPGACFWFYGNKPLSDERLVSFSSC